MKNELLGFLQQEAWISTITSQMHPPFRSSWSFSFRRSLQRIKSSFPDFSFRKAPKTGCLLAPGNGSRSEALRAGGRSLAADHRALANSGSGAAAWRDHFVR